MGEAWAGAPNRSLDRVVSLSCASELPLQAEVTTHLLATRFGTVFAKRWTVPGDRAPMVLLHDSLGSVDQWRDFPALLAMRLGRSVLAYDRLGYGRSEARTEPPGPDFIDIEAHEHLPGVLRAMGIEQHILLGHSVGGAMAIAAAANALRPCLAVITESAQAFVEARTLQGIRAAKKSFEAPGALARLEKWHGEKARWVLNAWTEVWLSEAFHSWRLDPYLRSVRCPVLAIHGDRDEFGSDAFPRAIVGGVMGRGEMKILAPCGHVPHREHGVEVTRMIADFLCSHVP